MKAGRLIAILLLFFHSAAAENATSSCDHCANNSTCTESDGEYSCECLTGYTGTHLRRLEEKGLFPKRFKLNPESGPFGAVGWLESDIEDWMEARAASIKAA